MSFKRITWVLCIAVVLWLNAFHPLVAQDTQILGFVAGETQYEDEQLSFGIGEQDLFITSHLNDNISFLGETVFKFSSNSATDFNVSVERIIVAYNYKGNHSILFGKHHTPVNYWNDSYHHGRVFFPTIARPLLFSEDIIPIHTTGIAFKGINLGDLRFGYNLMIGNGLGSTDVAENDKAKSITAAVSIKPVGDWHFGASVYRDDIAAGASIHGMLVTQETKQMLYTGTIAHFGQKFELLAESTLASNETGDADPTYSTASYIYGGLRLNEKLVPYLRYDHLEYEAGEQFFMNEDTDSIIAGLRYEVNYLVVLKMEYQYIDREVTGSSNVLNAQVAIGF